MEDVYTHNQTKSKGASRILEHNYWYMYMYMDGNGGKY